MKAVVKSTQNTGTWEGHGKMFNLYEIQIGEHVGQYMSNKYMDKEATDFPFIVGQEAEYEYTGGDHPKIKLPKKDFQPSNNAPNASKSYGDDSARQLMIVRQSSLNRAIEILIHNKSKIPDPTIGDSMVDEIEAIELAERLTKWVMQPEKKEEPYTANAVEGVAQEVADNMTG